MGWGWGDISDGSASVTWMDEIEGDASFIHWEYV